MGEGQDRSTFVEPLGWWGPFRRPAPRRSVLDLLRDRTLDAPLAALLWALLARRASLTVVAGPSGAGKTTLLTALLDFLPAGERRIYLRGCYEPFDFLGDPAVMPEATALLVNEISPHLPIYLWGPGVGRLQEAAQSGFRVLATAHAAGAADLVALLAGYPLRLPPAAIAALGLVLVLDTWSEAGEVRRVARELSALRATESGGIAITELSGRGRTETESELDRDAAGEHVMERQEGGRVAAVAAEVAVRAATLRRLAAEDGTPADRVGSVLAAASAAAGLDPARGPVGPPSGWRRPYSDG